MNFDAIKVVKMQNDHVYGVNALEKICFSQPWSLKSIEAELKNEHARFRVALNEGKVIGYVGMYNICACGYVTNIAVDPEYRRMGVAKKLLEEIIKCGLNEETEFISLEVRESNVAAIRLYECLGFKNVGMRKNFYTKPIENAIIMTKYLRREL